MKLSVALCTYNGESYLKDQLLSIIHQTVPPDELIICDDHSTDTTIEIIDSLKTLYPFPMVLHLNPVNLGSTKNFEKALRLCTHDIIAFADQDDVWKPQKLEMMVKAFSADPQVGFVFTDAALVDAHLKPMGTNLWESVGFDEKAYKDYIGGKQFETTVKRNVTTGTTMAIKSSLKELILPFPKKRIHDEWIATLMSIVGIKGVPIPETLVLYRQHPRQQVGFYKESMWEIIRNSLKTGAADYERLASAYREVKERIVERYAELDQDQRRRIALLERKVNHFLQRKLIQSSSGLSKFRLILHETRLGNYQSFSFGFLSIGRDLFFKGQEAPKNRSNTKV
jgi:glycosyltransferase involved in cell wall biosynthesis